VCVEKSENQHLPACSQNSDLATISSAGTSKVKRRKAVHFRLISESVSDRLIFKPGPHTSVEEFGLAQIVTNCSFSDFQNDYTGNFNAGFIVQKAQSVSCFALQS